MKGEASDIPIQVRSLILSAAQDNPTMKTPQLAMEFNPFLINKNPEFLIEAKTDSGVTSSSECPSTSPSSYRSGSPAESAFGGVGTQIPYEWKNITPMKFNGEPLNAPRARKYEPFILPKIETSDQAETPKARFHSRRKVLKCKQCIFVADTKKDLWDHSKVHIKEDKILTCPTCPFVTEYKHHLEYHIRKHTGTKPFKCDQCDYSCINKSMLNSHLKSHSNVYQYRCSDCPYETKYCHSLKLHLRKRNHRPAMVLNRDGSPNPLPIVDVYGTKRGPKVKTISGQTGEPSSLNLNHQMPYNPVFNHSSITPLPLPLIPGFMPPEMILNFQHILRQRLEELAKQNEGTLEGEEEVLDLSCKNKSAIHDSEESESECDEEMTTMFFNVEVVGSGDKVEEKSVKQEKEEIIEAISDVANNNQDYFTCHYCDIRFKEEEMFRVHMGYHSSSNPFTCNTCGKECENKVNLFLHIAIAAH